MYFDDIIYYYFQQLLQNTIFNYLKPIFEREYPETNW